MAVRRDLAVIQGNTETVDLTVSDEATGASQDLTAKTLDLLIKPTQLTADSDGGVITLSSGGGSPAIVITDAPNGLATATILYSVLPAPGDYWWRLDVAEDHKTVMLGTFTVEAV